MQAHSVFVSDPAYTAGMAAGRPAKFKRSAFGERLVAARQQLGLSQIQVADKLGISQQTYAGWERRTTALRPEHIAGLAGLMNVSVDHLLGRQATPKRSGGPVGRARRLFEQVSQLPRHQQQRILSLIEDLLAAQRFNNPATAI